VSNDDRRQIPGGMMIGAAVVACRHSSPGTFRTPTPGWSKRQSINNCTMPATKMTPIKRAMVRVVAGLTQSNYWRGASGAIFPNETRVVVPPPLPGRTTT
jgi:hypothetical protein